MNEQLEAGAETLRQTTGFLAQLGEKFVNYLPTILVALIVFLIGMLLAKLTIKLMSRTMRKSKVDKTATGFGLSLIRIVIYVLLVVICLSILGVPTASLITIIGTAGVTIGLALQNGLSNLAGGFMLLFAKPFQVGDYIKAGGEEGFVESISILYTELRTHDNRCVFIPNSNVSTGNVINFSRRGKLRIIVKFSVSYRTDIKQAREALLTAIDGHPMFLKDPKPAIAVSELADSGIVLAAYLWIERDHYIIAPSTALELIKNTLDEAGIEIPYPQIVVHQNKE